MGIPRRAKFKKSITNKGLESKRHTTKCIINGGVQCKFVVYFLNNALCRGTVKRFELPPLLMHKRWQQLGGSEDSNVNNE